jgi:hypothetical protein
MSRFVAINLAGMSPPDTIETLETGTIWRAEDVQWQSNDKAIEAAC